MNGIPMSDQKTSSAASSSEAGRVTSPQIRPVVLYVAALGFALWGLGWFVLIPNHQSQLGWALEFLGPLLIAIAIIMYEESLTPRIGRLAVVLASGGALIAAFSTSIFAISPANLEKPTGVAFGYAAYGVGLILGALSLGAVLVRKEQHLSSTDSSSYPVCPVGCVCGTVIHSSFASIALGAAGLLTWGIGFLDLAAQPSGSEIGWDLSVVGSLFVTIALFLHFEHLSARFGRAAIVTGMLSAAIWSFGYLLQAINPNAGVLSSWYTDLFLCYGIGHLLTAASLLLVARRKAALDK
jgi:hypothetical protein